MEERGVLNFKCELCDVTVFGKKNMDSHIEGKKHLSKVATVTLAGKTRAQSHEQFVVVVYYAPLDPFRLALIVLTEKNSF
jgi:hypothetical protein